MSSRRGTGGSPTQERRVDPEHGVALTLEELRDNCKGQYSEQQILDWWARMPPYVGGEGEHSVTIDPFLTDLSRMQRPSASAQLPSHARSSRSPRARASGGRGSMESDSSGPGQPRETVSAEPPRGTMQQQQSRLEGRTSQAMVSPVEAGLADVQSDPFLTAGGANEPVSVKEDPFLTRQRRAAEESARRAQGQGQDPSAAFTRSKQFAKQAAAAKKHWSEYCYRIVGDGYIEREPWAQKFVILIPWGLFSLTLILGVTLRHSSVPVTMALTGCFLVSSLAMILFWFQGQRRGPISHLTMGVLCVLATTAGFATAVYGWDHHWRQFWWTQTGFRDAATSALTPAASRADHSILNFWDENRSTTFNGTRVDNLKSAGYKDTDYYCVAPILAPASAGAGLARVNFWAVGVNCCQRYGGFTCDNAREWNAGIGLVMLNGGMPCPTCNADKFKMAIAKAEAMHGLVSVEGALFVRWVGESSHLETWLALRSIGYLVLCAGVALGAFFVLGGTAWYYGLGIQQTGERLASAYTPAAEKITYGSADTA